MAKMRALWVLEGSRVLFVGCWLPRGVQSLVRAARFWVEVAVDEWELKSELSMRKWMVGVALRMVVEEEVGWCSFDDGLKMVPWLLGDRDTIGTAGRGPSWQQRHAGLLGECTVGGCHGVPNGCNGLRDGLWAVIGSNINGHFYI
ncbi:hypothetical protein GQ457_02G028630 [Hibiscus cannabinus]